MLYSYISVKPHRNTVKVQLPVTTFKINCGYFIVNDPVLSERILFCLAITI